MRKFTAVLALVLAAMLGSVTAYAQANPGTDLRISWSGTYAALIAANPNPAFPNGTLAPTSDMGWWSWNTAKAAWVPVAARLSTTNGYTDDSFLRWRPTGNATATLTGTPAVGDTTETLNGNWARASGLYKVTFSTGEVASVLVANGTTTFKLYPYPTPSTVGTYGPAYALKTAPTTAVTVAGQPPVVGVSNYYSTTASISSAATAVLAATVPDVPRNVIGAWTGTAVATVAGTDYYGNVQTEASASGTSLASKKTFASITSITMSASVTGATFGTGNVLGLPYRVSSGDVDGFMFNDAADAGTFVVPDLTIPASSSTGDVRGTYAPAGTLNGVKFLSVILKVTDLTTSVGTLGVTPQ